MDFSINHLFIKFEKFRCRWGRKLFSGNGIKLNVDPEKFHKPTVRQ